MFKKYKKVMSVMLASMMLVTGCSSDDVVESKGEEKENSQTQQKEDVENKEPKQEKGEPVIIKYGSHASREEDPEYKDPITGAYTMGEEAREHQLKVVNYIEETLNVDFQFVQYPGDTSEVLLQSVLAGDPICDFGRIYTYGAGTLLGQNILQPLGEWEELLQEEQPPKVLDDYYFLRLGGDNNITFLPLMYNISYIEDVDALKVDGKTVYPTDLYLDGNWTWSVFKEYLTAIDKHYANSQAPNRPEKRIEAFWSSHYDIVLQAVHSAGGSIYGRDGLGVQSDATKEAVAFTEDLITSRLVYVQNEGQGNQDIVDGRISIGKGESVFSLIEDWKSRNHSKMLADRGQSMGYVPFPRPDHMAFDDPNYRDCRIPGESYAVLKGIDEEKMPLVIKAAYMYLNGETGEPKEEKEKEVFIGIDVFHPEIGTDMVEIYRERSAQTVVNEMADIFKVSGKFIGLVGRSIYGKDNTPTYTVAIEQEIGIFDDAIATMEAAVSSEEPRDNITPRIKQVEAKDYAYPIGTDLEAIDFVSDFEATDNIDGALNMKEATFGIEGIDSNVSGKYTDGLVVKIKDKSDNEGKLSLPVVIYDDKNTDAPTLEAKEEYRTIKLEEDISKINWGNAFVKVAVDKDGIPLNNRVVADLSELDTTTVGKYNVTLTVVDYANNEVSITIEVEVADTN